jgi:hypothetical protein
VTAADRSAAATVGARAAATGERFAGTGDNLLDGIIESEGTAKGGRNPFNIVLGYGRYGTPDKPLTDMTLAEAYQFGRSVRRRHGSSSALGAFQIVGSTMKEAMKWTGLKWGDKFSAENQSLMARAIRRVQGLGAWEGFKHNRAALAKARSGKAGDKAPEAPATPAASAPSAAIKVGARAAGGPVRAGGTYLVGEKGPELHTFGRSGYVHTAASTKAMLAAGESAKGALARFAAIGAVGDATGAPRVAALSDAVADLQKRESGGKSVTITRGDTHVTVHLDGKSGDARDNAREVERVVRRVLAQHESDQRGLLSD